MPLAPQPLLFDQPCTNCGYNLRTIPQDGICPECGHPVQVSLETTFGRWSRPALRRLQLATRWMAWTGILYLLALAGFRAAIMGLHLVYEDFALIFFLTKLQSIIVATIALAHVSAAWIASSGLWPPAGREKRIRVAAVLFMVYQIMGVVMALIWSAFFPAILTRVKVLQAILIAFLAAEVVRLAVVLYFWDTGSRLAAMRRESGLEAGVMHAWGMVAAIGSFVEIAATATPLIVALAYPSSGASFETLFNAAQIARVAGMFLAAAGFLGLIAGFFQFDARLGKILRGEV